MFKYSFENEKSYVVKLTYQTNNLYTETLEYKFQILQFQIDKIAASINTYVDNDEGRIKIHLKATNAEPYVGNFTIRRTSSESDFKIWEDVLTDTLTDGKLINYTWYDTTIQSGIWYKYGVQKRTSQLVFLPKFLTYFLFNILANTSLSERGILCYNLSSHKLRP